MISTVVSPLTIPKYIGVLGYITIEWIQQYLIAHELLSGHNERFSTRFIATIVPIV